MLDQESLYQWDARAARIQPFLPLDSEPVEKPVHFKAVFRAFWSGGAHLCLKLDGGFSTNQAGGGEPSSFTRRKTRTRFPAPCLAFASLMALRSRSLSLDTAS